MNELELIIEKYLIDGSKATVFYVLEQEEFEKVIANLQPYEKPDILSIYENKIIGIEHFEFDSYDNFNKKGSDYKIKDNKIKENFDKKVRDGLGNLDSIIIHDEIKSTSSFENYCKNFKKIFKAHYKKIDSYITHIKEDFDCTNKEISIYFFAEDVTPFGSSYLNKNIKPRPDLSVLLPIHSPEIRKLLENSPLVKYLIVGMYIGDKYRLFIIENSKEVLDKFEKEIGNVEEKDFFAFDDIQSIGFSFEIPKNTIE